MIDRVLYEHIRDHLIIPEIGGVTPDFRYGSAEGSNPPYIVLFKVEDPERPFVLCEEQGEAGQALFQFSGYANKDASNTITWLESLKRQVALIKGVIGVDTQYRIINNITSGVIILRENSLSIWGSVFDCQIWWELVREET